MDKFYEAANWSLHEDGFTQMFRNQNTDQFWKAEDFALNGDILVWERMSKAEQTTYMRALTGLTLLDTLQGNEGVSALARYVKGNQRKSVLTFMAAMENVVHAPSYSTIFMTFANSHEIDSAFAWAHANPHLQKKARIIDTYYDALEDTKGEDEIALYKAMVASVMLESFLFYSGFYYPLLLAGDSPARLTNSGEIINAIIKDEAIHGAYVGLLAQEIFNRQGPNLQAHLTKWATELVQELYENESAYTEDLYAELGIATDVKAFLRYNANKAMMNVNLPTVFEDEPQNEIVINGLNTKTASHDFFSQKGTYKKATVEALRDEDFSFWKV